MSKLEVIEALRQNGFFRHFIGPRQRRFLMELVDGEEGQHFIDTLSALKKRIESMPKPYETDGQGKQAVVHLHYFRGGVDAWITEKDAGPAAAVQQLQAFGMITLTGDKSDAEMGYISIQELIDNGVEIDLYWEPKTLMEALS